MNDLQIFESSEFGKIRTVEIDGKPYFVATDVARALGYSNPRKAVNDHCKGVTKCDTPTSSGVQRMSYINEGDLYRLIMKSKLPSAEKFESWVMDEVLPTIRKTGSYNKPMTTAEKIHLLAQSDEELTHRVDEVEAEVEELKETMPLLAVDCDRITNAVKAKGVETLGGKDSNSYKDRSLRGRVYADIHREVKRQFGVTTYKAIKRNQCEKAVAFVRNYNVPFVLQEEIAENNAQLNLEVTA
jgi:prophage antirepressor-like protein|nr:MAG TPA: repressor domain protein [Bacteriophage sp.]